MRKVLTLAAVSAFVAAVSMSAQACPHSKNQSVWIPTDKTVADSATQTPIKPDTGG